MSRCHLIIEPQPLPGSWNMAVDEVLLETAARDGRCFLRWYQWSEATLSLGYFQARQPTAKPLLGGAPSLAPDTPLPVVRRLSGGGAILHHHEWTYSCVIPATHPLARSPRDLYAGIHHAMVHVLHDLGYPVACRGSSAPDQDAAFLCFSRGDALDVLLQGHKVLGSAQRRRRGAILQHGSLLIRRSPHAPQFPGLFDLVHLPAPTDDSLRQHLTKALVPLLGDEFIPDILSPAETDQVQELLPTYVVRP